MQALLVLALAALVCSFVNWSVVASLDFLPLWDYRVALLKGLGLTLFLAVESIGVGLVMGMTLAALLQSPIAPLRWLINAYVEVLRDTPLIVELFWVHFALPMVTGISTTALQSGVIAITLQASAYLTGISRGGIQAVPKGQWDAAYALGLNGWTRWTSVILPQALKIMLPPLANVAISFFKTTSFLSALSVGELLSTANRVGEASFRPIESLTVAAVIYFAIGSLFSYSTHRLERTARRSER